MLEALSVLKGLRRSNEDNNSGRNQSGKAANNPFFCEVLLQESAKKMKQKTVQYCLLLSAAS